ncbi:MAG: FAD-binding protein [Coriobacteriaceae bacterium]
MAGQAVRPRGHQGVHARRGWREDRVFRDQIATFKADTLEELAEKLGITDTAAFVESVKRYNECVAAGKDLDFGKEAKWLTAIDTPPFYGIHRHVRVSAVVSGVNVGPNMEVLAVETNEPIPGLFAIGNTAGNFYGGVDYSMYMPACPSAVPTRRAM